MNRFCRIGFCFFLLLSATFLFAQQKFALVIGNGDYTGISKLPNPVNDANDMTEVLQGLGFTVDEVLNGSQVEIDDAVIRLKNRLSVSQNSYGFFFYAGHAVQNNGENYLLPVDANIPTERYLDSRAVSVQTVLNELNDAGNELNIVVLDACRNNPFGWSRSASRGLAVTQNLPADSIIVYATSDGDVAADGTGRNGLFTSQLLINLRNQDLEVQEIFRRTGADVDRISNGEQIPAIYSQFFGNVWLGEKSSDQGKPTEPIPVVQQNIPTGEISIASGSIEIKTITPGRIHISGNGFSRDIDIPAYGSYTLSTINAGSYTVSIVYENQTTEEKQIQVGRNENVLIDFNYEIERLPIVQTPVDDRNKASSVFNDPERFWSIGAAVGSSFADPWMTGTVFGTIAPFNYSFLELGFEAGFVSGIKDAGYYSLYPYARYSFYKPFTENLSGYIGAGGGYMMAQYQFDDLEMARNIFAADIALGIVLFNFNISYSLRSDFSSASNKLSIGYVYRF